MTMAAHTLKDLFVVFTLSYIRIGNSHPLSFHKAHIID